MSSRVANAAERLTSSIRAGLLNIVDLFAPTPVGTFVPVAALPSACSTSNVAAPVALEVYRAEAQEPPSSWQMPQADRDEAWALASALEVLANYFEAHPGGGGVQFRALVNRAAIGAEHGVGVDAIADRLRAWAEAIKAPISQQTGGMSLPPDNALFIWDPVAEAERTVREAKDEQTYTQRLDRWIEILHELERLALPANRGQVRKLCNEFDALHGDTLKEAEDRVLYVAADVLKEAQRWDLFARIFAQFLEGSYYETGDEVDFYYRRARASNRRADKRGLGMRLDAAERQKRRDEAGELPKPANLETWLAYVRVALGGHSLGDPTCTVDDCGARADGPYPKDCPDGCGGLVHSGGVVSAEWSKCDRCQYRSDPMRWSWGEDGRLIERTWRELGDSGELG